MDILRIVEPLASFLIDIAAKGTVLLVLTLFVTWVLRRSSAAMRHAVWSLTMLSLVLLPVTWWALPSLAIPILPHVESSVASVKSAESTTVAKQSVTLEPRSFPHQAVQLDPDLSSAAVVSSDHQREVVHVFRAEPKIAPLTQPVDRVSKAPPLPAVEIPDGNTVDLLSMLISFVWFFGVTLFAMILALCVLKAVVLRRRSQVVTTGDWYRLLAELSQRLRIRRSVELREHSDPIVPLTWGVFRSVVLLPKSAREWAEPMKRTVLLHELAHVRRGDVASQLLGRIACTIFWFHPLAWYGLRRLRQEGEQACDDAVVHSGERASDYADQLLQVAQICCEPRGLSLGVAMAEGNSLEVRVKSLFDKTRSHEPVRRSMSLILVFLCAITLAAVSVVRPVASSAVAAESSLVLSATHPEPVVEPQRVTRSRTPQLSVPEEWKSGAFGRIVKLAPEFGPEHDGLKLGITRSTGQTVFRMGDRIPLELFVMNVGLQEKTLQFQSAPQISYAPEVVDSNGQAVRGISGTTVLHPPYSVGLKPGEACSIPVSGLGIGDQGAANFKSPIAGRYEMSYRVGSLKSATMRIKVGTDKEGSFRLDVLDDRWGLRHGSAERISILKPVFGKASRGIEMGIAFAGMRKKYSTGEKIPIDLFFRNVGEKNLKFQFTADFNWAPPTVVNELGERVHILPLPVWMFEGPRTVNLEPGQTFGIHTRGLGLSKGNGVLSLVSPVAGKYRIGFARTIYDYVDPRVTRPDQVHEWDEHLISGSLEIEVVDGKDGVQTAKLLPGNSESLKVLEDDATRISQKLDELPEPPSLGNLSPLEFDVPPPSEPKPAEPSEPTPKDQAKIIPLQDVIWWKKVDGLQAGFLLDSPAIPNQRIPYNSVARYRILVRNTTDKDIRFVARLLPHEGADAPYLISSDDITNSLAAPQLPEKFRAQGIERKSRRPDPAYVILLAPGEAVFIPGQSGLDELSLYVGEVEERKNPTVSKIRPGMNWIVQPLQIRLFPLDDFSGGTSLMGRFKITKVDQQGITNQKTASRMVAIPGGETLSPRIQLDVGTLTADAARNAKHAKWGEVDKGLQCGIRLLNPEPSYVRGDMLEAELLWRNVSDAAIHTPIPRRLDLYPMVQNAGGELLPIDFGSRFMIYPISMELKPGEVRSLGIFKIKLVDEPTPSPKSNAEPAHLTLEPGTYKLSGSGGVSAKDGGNPKSAKIEFNVISR